MTLPCILILFRPMMTETGAWEVTAITAITLPSHLAVTLLSADY
ncbi:hypothetical protein NXW20_00560 [Bacteroides faecis]|nr:hypothetical protein [Bacteroides faecis]MCS2194228.1 hypothetical protein [Bacteroides faecis]